ncbi:MAG: type III-A CRISPR-associated CARF protein Csm6 [Candidatus Ventricola sp.]
MPDVLFTCAGTTDPVRGGHDGGVLHIMRHYRPQRIYLFLSAEMNRFERQDHRFEKMFRYAAEKWVYAPEWFIEQSGIDNVADLDAVNEPLCAFFRRAEEENPGCRILVNLSSGSPQMKIALAQLALSVRHNVVGVQVSNPEKKSGDSKRTNDERYVVDDELELNEDDEPGAPNRCSEPKMLAMQRDRQRAQIRSLLERRDYRALEAMRAELPTELAHLASHLAARSDLQLEEAAKLARGLRLPFKLYPSLKATDEDYKLLSEYYLLLRNLQLTQRYTEFVLRINPFLTQLLLHLVERSLPCPLNDILEQRQDKRICLNPDAMERCIPDVKRALERATGRIMEPSKDFSLYIGVPLLRVMGGLSPALLDVLDACEALNREQRNPAAHQLHAVTKEQIEADCVDGRGRHYSPAALARAFGQMLKAAYPEVCDEGLFSVYDRCEDYFLRRF